MTLIAHFRFCGGQTLIGDLLISSKQRPPTSVAIPAARSINERIFLPPNHFVAGLRQKLVLLGDHLVVAWSRSHQQAEDLISTLAPLGMIGPVEATFLESALAAIDSNRKNDLSYIVCCVDGLGRQHMFSQGTSGPADVGPMSQVVSAGSGSSTFLELAAQFSGNVVLMNSSAGAFELRQGFDLGFVAALAGEEFASPAGIQRGWGGGYEIIRQNSGRFQKVGGVLSLFFSVTESGSDTLLLWWHTTFRHTDYWRGLTVVQAIEHELRDGKILDVGRHDVFLVSAPGVAKVPTEGFLPPDVNQYNSILTWVVTPNEDDTLVYASAWELPVFQYSFQRGRIHVSFNQNFIGDIVMQVQSRLRRRVTFSGLRPSPFLQSGAQ